MAVLVLMALAIGACSDGKADSVATDPTPAKPAKSGRCKVSPKLVSGCGVWWGAFVSPDPDVDDTSIRPLLKLERQIGRRLAIVHRYHDMSKGQRGPFPNAVEREIGKDRLLYIGWASRVYGGVDHNWQDIADGKLDASVIDPAARRVASYGRPLFLDFDHEPETDSANDGTDSAFVAAYRHIHDRFQTLGATNAIWVWTVTGFEDHWDRYDALYPGDDVVDWVAWDPYDFNECHETGPQTFEQTIDPFYDWLVDHHPTKPFMLGEYGTVVDQSDPEPSIDYYEGVVPALEDHPRIRAVVQFDHRPEVGLRCDTRLQPESVLEAFADAGHEPYVNPPPPP